jgi:hypothetical protein
MVKHNTLYLKIDNDVLLKLISEILAKYSDVKDEDGYNDTVAFALTDNLKRRYSNEI